MAEAPRVLVSLIDEKQEYQRLLGSEAQAAAARLGIEVEVVYSSGDPATQSRCIEQAIRAPEGSRPAAVVVHPISVGSLELVARAALQAGVGWVSLEPVFYAGTLQRANPTTLVAVVAADEQDIGRLQARTFRALLPQGGKVVYVEGPFLSPAAVARREGMREGLLGSRVEIAKTLLGDWTEASGEKAAMLWLRLGNPPRPDLIGVQNDLMAAGVRKAIQTWKPEWLDVPITGCDGLPEGGQRMVREKLLAATVIQPVTTGAAIELVAKALRGEKVEPSTRLPARAFPSLEELGPRTGG